MKKIFVVFLLATSSNAVYSQFFTTNQWYNRTFVNAELGFHYYGWGAQVHIFEHFAIGYNAGQYSKTVSEAYVDHYIFGMFPRNAWVMNRYNFKSITAGITTGNMGRFCATLMVGPSFIEATEYSNVVIYEHQSTDTEYPKYNRTISDRVGATAKLDLLFAQSDVFGYNVGLRYDAIPGLHSNNLTFQLGLNVGIVENYQECRRF